MPPQLEDVLKKVSAAWGSVQQRYASAMCAAQLLEGELIQIMAFLRIRTGELNSPDFESAYAKMERMRAKEILSFIRGCGGNLSLDDYKIIEGALKSRNFLAHRFFHEYNPVANLTECKRAVQKLRKIESELNAAYKLLQPLRQNLEERLKLTAIRKDASENFKRDFLEAMASFYDN
jgi:hypothetical protein